MTTTIDLLRHGAPQGGRRYRGQIDDPLSEPGWREMRHSVGDGAPWECIITSPLQRCRVFAEHLAQRHALPLEQDSRLMEVGFGVWEGNTREQIEARWPGAMAAFQRDPVGARPEGAEPLHDFFNRVNESLDQILRAHAGQRTLMIAHAGVIRAVLVRVLQAPLSVMYRIQVSSAGLSRIRRGEGRPLSLVFHDARRMPDD